MVIADPQMGVACEPLTISNVVMLTTVSVAEGVNSSSNLPKVAGPTTAWLSARGPMRCLSDPYSVAFIAPVALDFVWKYASMTLRTTGAATELPCPPCSISATTTI